MHALRRLYRKSGLAYFVATYCDYRRTTWMRAGYWPLQAAWLTLGWVPHRYQWIARLLRRARK